MIWRWVALGLSLWVAGLLLAQCAARSKYVPLKPGAYRVEQEPRW